MPNSYISMIILENIFQNSINQNLASVKKYFIMPICGEVFGTRFLSCYKYALKWVTLFMIPKYDIFESCIFSKGNHYLLSLCTCWNTNLSSKIFGFIRRNNKDPRFPVNDNIASYPFIFVQQTKLPYSEGTFYRKWIPNPWNFSKIKTHSEHLDEHHEMLFYYKIASIYFVGKYADCILYLENHQQ
jgi:hypothetical protein